MSFVALLRGINLGKINKVDMKSLKSLFEELGYLQVQTYIQTGNVIFHNHILDEHVVETKLHTTYGFEIPVTIRTKAELEEICQHPLFAMDNVYVMFLKERLSEYQISMLKSIVDEKFAVVNQNTIIIHLSKSYHQTKYTNNFFENKLHTFSTARNRNTVEKILAKM